MTVLEKLIRYHRFLLDEKRRALRDLEEREARIAGAIDELEAEIRVEQAAAAGSEASFAYGGYAARAVRRRRTLRTQLKASGDMVDQARQDLAGAFEELKKYEITQEARNLAARRDESRREQADLDEVALSRHRRGEGAS